MAYRFSMILIFLAAVLFPAPVESAVRHYKFNVSPLFCSC